MAAMVSDSMNAAFPNSSDRLAQNQMFDRLDGDTKKSHPYLQFDGTNGPSAWQIKSLTAKMMMVQQELEKKNLARDMVKNGMSQKVSNSSPWKDGLTRKSVDGGHMNLEWFPPVVNNDRVLFLQGRKIMVLYLEELCGWISG